MAGVPTDAAQIDFRNTGHNSSLGWFAAHEILASQSVRRYDGPMAKWTRNDTRPMVRPAAVTD